MNNLLTLTPKNFGDRNYNTLYKMVIATAFIYVSSVQANSQWQPVASDTLIKLPANIIQQRVQSDFSASPLAQRLSDVEQALSDNVNQIKSLQGLQNQASADELTDISFDIIDKKSNYLGLLKESHELRQQALDKRQALYENILSKINNQDSGNRSDNSYQLNQAKKLAKARMIKSAQAVEDSLNLYKHQGNFDGGFMSLENKEVSYQNSYQGNLNKITQLKESLVKHRFNKKPEIDGVAVSDKEYIRSLLMKLATERSLLSQENTMLAYMTKLVALDAESLTAQLSKNTDITGSNEKVNVSRANQVTDLFINGAYNE